MSTLRSQPNLGSFGMILCSCERRFYFGLLPCGRGWIALLEQLDFLLLIKGAGSAKVLPPTDGVLVGVVHEFVPLVVLVVEHVRNHFMISVLVVCSGECIPFLSGTEAGCCAVLFLCSWTCTSLLMLL